MLAEQQKKLLTIQITFHHATYSPALLACCLVSGCSLLTCLASWDKLFLVACCHRLQNTETNLLGLTYVFFKRMFEGQQKRSHDCKIMHRLTHNWMQNSTSFSTFLSWFSQCFHALMRLFRSFKYFLELGFQRWQVKQQTYHDWNRRRTPNILLSAAVLSECESILLGWAHHEATNLAEGVEQLSWTVKEHRLSAASKEFCIKKVKASTRCHSTFF